MASNPYQSPRSPGLSLQQEIPVDTTGISHHDYLKFRRAAALLTIAIAIFFLLFCVQMIQESMLVEAAIASSLWITMLVCAGGILMRRTAPEAELTLKKYRNISSSMRQLCFWLGPLMFVVGVLQIACLPTTFRFNPWGFVLCGTVAFGCAFQWPRTLLLDQDVDLDNDI